MKKLANILRRTPVVFVLMWAMFNIHSLLPIGIVGDVVSVLFLLPVLGLIIMRCFGFATPKHDSTRWLEQLLLATGIGIINIIVIGLLLSIIPSSPTDGYLRLPYLLIAFDIEAALLVIFYVYRARPTARKFTLPKLSRRDLSALVLSSLVCLMSIAGAIALNNHASPIFAISSTALSAAIIIYMMIKPGSSRSIAVSLYLIAASYLLAGWLRSSAISAVDTNMEYFIFDTVYQFGKWSPELFPGHAYNACMSITVLPTVLQNFLHIDPIYMYKVVFALIYALVAPIIYITARHTLKKPLAIVASVIYIAQPAFMTYLSIPPRQQIAMLFFALLVMVIIGSYSYRQKRALAVVLFVGILLSHYTTAYITCGIVLVAYIVERILSRYASKKPSRSIGSPVFSLTLIIIMFVSTVVWYNNVTSTSGVTTSFITKNLNSMNEIFSPSTQANKASILNQFNPFFKAPSAQSKLDTYYEDFLKDHPHMTADAPPKLASQPSIPSTFSDTIGRALSGFRGILQVASKLLIILGVAYLLRLHFRSKQKMFTHSVVMSAAALITLGTLLLLPFLSETYDASRTFQQILIILAVPLAIGIGVVCRDHKRLILAVSSVMIVSLIGFGNGFINQIIGGGDPSINYNNEGTLYNRVYVDVGELAAASWLDEQDPEYAILADRMAVARLTLSQRYGHIIGAKQTVFNSTIGEDRYIYLRRQNLSGTGTINIKGSQYDYTFPKQAIEHQKNRIYANRSSQIYK